MKIYELAKAGLAGLEALGADTKEERNKALLKMAKHTVFAVIPGAALLTAVYGDVDWGEIMENCL